MIRITHLTGGVLVSAAYIDLANIPYDKTLPFYFFAGLAGSVLPDIDLIMGRRTDTSVILKHRGVTHTFLFVVLCIIGIKIAELYSGGGFLVSPGMIFVFVLCVLSHFALDTLNYEGILLLWPLSGRRFALGLIKAGSFAEFVLVLLPLSILAVFLMYKLNFFGGLHGLRFMEIRRF